MTRTITNISMNFFTTSLKLFVRGLVRKIKGKTRILALAMILAALYKAWKAYSNLTRALDSDVDRGFRLGWAWLLGRKLSKNVFNPVCPGGTREGVTWYTSKDGLVRCQEGKVTVTQPVIPCVGVASSGFTKWNVDCSRIDDDYVHVELTPQSWNERAGAGPVSDVRSTIQGDWVSRREMGSVSAFAVARLDSPVAVRLTFKEEEALKSSLRVAGTKTQAYSIGTVLKAISPKARADEEVSRMSYILASYWEERWPKAAWQPMIPRQALQTVEDRRADNEAPHTPTGRVIGPDLCMEVDAAPMMGKNNDLVAVDQRLDLVRNTTRDMPAQYKAYAREFAKFAVDEDSLTPMSLDEVIEAQVGRFQRMRNELARCWVLIGETKIKVKAMLKKEAISNSGPVRNISTLRPEANLRLSRYTLPMSAHLKTTSGWYVAGLTPQKVAERIVAICEGADRVTAADISKMDACKNIAITANLLHAMYIRAFQANMEELEMLHIAEALCTAETSSGDRYAAAGSQLSGSSTTTNHNTIVNAWLSYCAYRVEGKSAEEAYECTQKGLFVGDDSVSQNTPDSIETVGRVLGYKIVAEVIPRGHEVPFLSRFWPDPWSGEQGSYQDPVRLLRKAAMSFSPPHVGVQQMALDKWRGYTELDPAVTVYHNIYSTLKRITGKEGREGEAEGPWYVKEYGGGWPQLWDADRSVEMRCGPAYPEKMARWLSHLTDWESWMNGTPPLVENQASVKCKTTVDPTDPVTPPPIVQTAEPPATATAGPEVDLQRKLVETEVREQLEARLEEVKQATRREKAREKAASKTKPIAPEKYGVFEVTPTRAKGAAREAKRGKLK